MTPLASGHNIHKLPTMRVGVMAMLLRTGLALSILSGFSGGVFALDARSDADIKKAIIAESIAAYPGPCPCPYNIARNGSSCGKRSAYSRPGGYAPLCVTIAISPREWCRTTGQTAGSPLQSFSRANAGVRALPVISKTRRSGFLIDRSQNIRRTLRDGSARGNPSCVSRRRPRIPAHPARAGRPASRLSLGCGSRGEGDPS